MDSIRKERSKRLKKIYWKVHHWVGLYAGLWIGLLSLTGAIAVFIPEIDRFIIKKSYDAISVPYSGEHPEFAHSLAELTARFPDYQSLSIHLPQTEEEVVRVEMVHAERQGGGRYEYFIDGGRDVILGKRLQQNSLANYLRQMHVRLFEHNWGRQLVGIAGIGLFLVSLTGLLIYGNFMKRQKWPQVRKKMNLRIQMADWHKVIGISALAFNMVIAITGAWLGLQPWLMKWLDISIPNQHRIAETLSPEEDRKTNIQWDKLFMSIDRYFPELKPARLDLSTNGAASILVSGNVQGQVYERNTNILMLSKTDFRPLFRYNPNEQPFSHQLYYVQEALHFGDFGGWGVKILYAILGLSSGVLSISGFIVYLFRKNKKNAHVRQKTTRVTFLVCILSLLFLVVIGFISTQMGYTRAAAVAEIIVNGCLLLSLVYLLTGIWRRKSIKT